MTTKERLHQLVDQLPDSELAAVERLLEERCADARGAMTAEDRAWLEADLSDLGKHEPYEWGPEGPPPVRPVQYVPGVGLVILEEGESSRGDQ